MLTVYYMPIQLLMYLYLPKARNSKDPCCQYSYLCFPASNPVGMTDQPLTLFRLVSTFLGSSLQYSLTSYIVVLTERTWNTDDWVTDRNRYMGHSRILLLFIVSIRKVSIWPNTSNQRCDQNWVITGPVKQQPGGSLFSSSST